MAAREDITLFSSVDRTKEPDFFKRFLARRGKQNPRHHCEQAYHSRWTTTDRRQKGPRCWMRVGR